MLLTLIVFAVLRYNTGWDYGAYIHTVENPYFWNNPETSRYSLFWRALFEMANKLNVPYLAIDVANVLTYLILYFSLDILKLSRKQKLQALLVYALWYEFYLTSFSTLRQALSMTMGVMMFALIQRQRFILSFLVGLLAYHIHSSAFVLIFLYPIYLIRNRLNFSWLCISTIIMVAILLSLDKILMALNLLNMDKYSVYLKWNDNYGGKLIYLNLILAIYFIFVFHKLKAISSIERQCYFMFISGVIGGIAIHFQGGSSVFLRMLAYYTLFLIFILYQSLNIFKEKRFLSSVLTCLLGLIFIGYLYIIANGGGRQLTPYVPYQCILFK